MSAIAIEDVGVFHLILFICVLTVDGTLYLALLLFLIIITRQVFNTFL